jgi:hypothetical protein
MSRRLLVLVAFSGLALAVASPASAATVPPTSPGTLVSANPSDITPHAQNGEVRAFAQIGGTTYAGGTFTAVKAAGASTWTSRSYLFAYNTSTGALSTTFLPTLDGAVNTLVVSPDGKLIAGGAFHTVNGVARQQLVELDPTTAQVINSWAGHSDGGIIYEAVVSGNNLYVGGAFHWMNGAAHSLLARLNATSGAIDPTFQINASVPRAGSEFVWTLTISPDGRTLVVGGNFTMVNGLSRNQIAMVDVSATPAVANWSTQRFVAPCFNWAFNSYVRKIDFSDDGSYFVVGAYGGGDLGTGADCDAISRWETSARGDVDHTWVNYTGTDSVTSILAADGVVYAGGHFRWVNNRNGDDSKGPGGIDRLGIAALNPSNGLPLNWNPVRTAGSQLPAGAANWGTEIWVLWRGSDGVYFGQDSDGMGYEYHGRMGMFPISSGRAISTENAPTGSPGFLYLRTANGQLTKVSFDGSTTGAPAVFAQPNLTAAGAAFSVGPKVYWSGGTQLQFSFLSGSVVQPPWTVGWNTWFDPSGFSGAFYLDGRMYYTKTGTNTLFYRYLEPDSYIVGCTEFTLPTVNLDWSTVRGMAYVNGKLVYGSTDGSLRSVPFDATAGGGSAVNGSAAVALATGASGLTWSSPTLLYARQ